MINIAIIFDRQDRCYRFGEILSGKVVIEADASVTFSDVWVAYGWCTHGRGNRDFGGLEDIPLAGEGTQLEAGQRREFHFRFRLPNGPATYHGHFLNVDCYLTAHAFSPKKGAFQAEEDILLLGGDAPGDYLLGDQRIAQKNIPRPSPAEESIPVDMSEVSDSGWWHPIFWSAIKMIISLGGITLIFILAAINLEYKPDADIYIILVAALGLYALVRFLGQALRDLYSYRFEIEACFLEPEIVHAGGLITCHVVFRTRTNVSISGIKATIYAQERITFPFASQLTTDCHIVERRAFEKPLNEQLSAGRPILLECVVPVDADAPASFSSRFNGLEWQVKVQVAIKGWPDWTETLPLTVLA